MRGRRRSPSPFVCPQAVAYCALIGSTAVRYQTVRCRGCGQPRELTARSAKRAGLCQHCLYPAKMEQRVTDKSRRWWFQRFTDHELVLLAADFTGEPVSLAAVMRQRMALVAAGRRRRV